MSPVSPVSTAGAAGAAGTDRSAWPTPAEWALAALTVVGVLGMARLFTDLSYLPPVLLAGATAHATAWWARRVGLGGLLAAGVTVTASLLAVAWTVLPGETTFGVPTPATWAAAREALAAAGAEFGRVVAPAAPATGFVLASALGAALVAALADWAAFRAGSTFEGAVPAFGLFVFTALLGTARHRWVAVAAEVAAIAAFAALHRSERRAGSTPWFASATRGRPAALVQGAAVLGLLAVIAAVVAGPRLPGASADPLLRWRQEDVPGDGRRTTISPLVDIRRRLVETSAAEVFTVASNARAYWRLTALDTFDGVIWSSEDSYKRAGGTLPTSGPLPPGLEVEQEFAISALSSIWLPAAYRPRTLGGIDDVSFNAASGSLIGRTATSDGLVYRVRSVSPDLTRAGLSEVDRLGPGEMEEHLSLPPSVSPRVRALAFQWTDGASGPYEVARALQDRLRQFTYDLTADPGHGDDALERFLFVTRRGYCEQFAGAYAVLARAVGLPARVAVGFTPGELGPDGRYHVQGLHAHAWPEVWLDGVGWVAFEPTPGRGMPRAEDYTGVPEAQASPQQPQVATTLAPTTTAPAAGGGTTTTAAPPPSPGEAPAIPDDTRRRVTTALLVLAAVVVAAAAWLVGVPAWRSERRRRRRTEARTVADRVMVAWAEADEALGLVGARRRPAESLTAHAERAAANLTPGTRPVLERLARSAELASYAPEVAREVAAEAVADAAAVERDAGALAPRGRRWRRMVDPRT